MACFINPQSLSSFDKRLSLSVFSSWFFSMSLMSDQCVSGFRLFRLADSLCISMISSFKTHARGRPGFFMFAIELKLPVPRFNSSADRKRGFLFSDLKTRVYDTRRKHMHALIPAVNSKIEKLCFAPPHLVLQKMALTSHFLLEIKMPRSIEHAIATQNADTKTAKSTVDNVRVHIIAE